MEEEVVWAQLMKRSVNKGTAEWFELSRRRCVDHLRALLSIQMARDSAEAILQQWEFQKGGNIAALHSSCVIAYARPFTNAATKNGNIKYPTKNLMGAPGFDKELHFHILDLRNRLIAHSDYAIFPSSIYLQTIGDQRLPITLGINVMGIFGMESYDLALRYHKHFSICATTLEQILNLECNELASEVRLHPAEFHKTNNIPEVKGQFSPGSELSEVPRPTGPAAAVEYPAFPEGLWRSVRQTPPSTIPTIVSLAAFQRARGPRSFWRRSTYDKSSFRAHRFAMPLNDGEEIPSSDQSNNPMGKSGDSLSSPFRKNIFVSIRCKSPSYPQPSGPGKRGVGHRHERWGRMRWTRRRF
jgi:hypothetical protein